jgi:DNA-binding response OmpR family regulator
MSGKALILMVEDQRGFRRIYQDVLTGGGYDVLTAEDGEIGWTLAREKKPDLILLDLGLPKLNGFEVLQKVRADESTRGIPVLIFSVVGEQADIDRALALGATDYTVKGFNTPRQVLERIAALLAGRAPAAHIPKA